MSLGLVLSELLYIYLYVLIGRVIIDWVMMFARQWHPRGFVLALVDIVFRLTDPPMKFIRRFVPPLRIGGVALDFGFLILLFGVQTLAYVVRTLF